VFCHLLQATCGWFGVMMSRYELDDVLSRILARHINEINKYMHNNNCNYIDLSIKMNRDRNPQIQVSVAREVRAKVIFHHSKKAALGPPKYYPVSWTGIVDIPEHEK